MAARASAASTPKGQTAPPARWIHAELVGRYGISIGGGTNEVQRNNLAERALGLPKEPRNDHLVPWREIPRS